ncbi:MAG TPA: hypothetical protein DF383_03275, partial [Deltaproteobacteria bacterium]|nr:hypothetical protein [Deltaproteobacteria bacterium]
QTETIQLLTLMVLLRRKIQEIPGDYPVLDTAEAVLELGAETAEKFQPALRFELAKAFRRLDNKYFADELAKSLLQDEHFGIPALKLLWEIQEDRSPPI